MASTTANATGQQPAQGRRVRPIGVGNDGGRRLADKAYDLRIFGPEHDASGRTSAREVSAADLGLPVLVVSQFTLLGDCRKGRRPSFVGAARPEAPARHST